MNEHELFLQALDIDEANARDQFLRETSSFGFELILTACFNEARTLFGPGKFFREFPLSARQTNAGRRMDE